MPLSFVDQEGDTPCPYFLGVESTPESEKPRKKVTVIVFANQDKDYVSKSHSSDLHNKYESSLILDNLSSDTSVLDIYYKVAKHFQCSPYSFFLKKSTTEGGSLFSLSDLQESTDATIQKKNVMVEMVSKEECLQEEEEMTTNHISSTSSTMTNSKYQLEVPEGPPPKLFGGKNEDDFNVPGVHRSQLQLLQEYGTVFKLKFNVGDVIFNADPDLIQEVFTTKSNIFVKNHMKYAKPAKLWFEDGIFTCDDDVVDEAEIWGIAHRILMPAFSTNGMKQYFHLIQDLLLGDGFTYINEQRSQAVDMTGLAAHFTFDVIGKAGFNLNFGATTTGKHPYLDMLETATPIAQTMRTMPYIQKPFFAPALLKTWTDLNQENAKWLDSLVDDRRKELGEGINPNGKDLLTLMLQDKDPKTGKSLSNLNIRYQLNTFMFAGHDSTSSAITMLLYNIALNGDVEEKILEEITRVVGDEELQYSHLSKLEYINQCINESLRMYPPAAAALKGCIEDTMLGSFPVKKGTRIINALWGVAHNPNVWPDPFKFDPNRWSPENSKDRNTFASLPFSFGPRGCIGRQLSIMEQRVFLFHIVRNYHIRLDPSCTPKVEIPLFMKPQGIYLTFKKRDNITSSRTMMQIPFGVPIISEAKGTMKTDEGKEQISIAPTSTIIEPIEKTSVVRILFGSNMGTCEAFAHEIKSKINLIFGCEIEVMALDTFFEDYLLQQNNTSKAAAAMTIIIASSYNGNPPDNAEAFYSTIITKKANNNNNILERVRAQISNFAVFGAGNSQWASTFQKVPTDIYESLKGLGGGCHPIASFDGGDAEEDLEGAFLNWSERILKQMLVNSGLPADSYEMKLHSDNPYSAFAPQYSVEDDSSDTLNQEKLNTLRDRFAVKNNFFLGSVSKNTELLCINESKDDPRSTRCVQIQLPSGLTYKAGDHLAVYGCNDLIIVERVAQALHIPNIEKCIKIQVTDADQTVCSIPSNIPINQGIPIRTALRFCVDLQHVTTRLQLEYLIHKCHCPPEKKELQAMISNYDILITVPKLTVFELLEKFRSIQLTLSEFITIMPALKPRYYSISSSPKSLPNAVEITVGVQKDFIQQTGRTHLGICSNFLATVGPGQMISQCFAFVKATNSTFRLPENPQTPMILIGPGTGVAPMMGFIREKDVLRHQSNTTKSDDDLVGAQQVSEENDENQYKGNRKSNKTSMSKNENGISAKSGGPIALYFGCRNDEDFIYREEMEAYVQNQTLTSLNVAFSRKKDEKKVYVQDLIAKDAAYLADLILNQNASVYICGDAKAMAPAVKTTFEKMLSEKGGKDYFKGMIASGRYCEDIWAGTN